MAVITSGAMGYACRLTHPRDLSEDVSERIDAAVPRTPAGHVDFDVMETSPEHLSALIEWSSETAGNPSALNALSGCSVASWQAFSATAGYAIQRNVLAKGLPKRLLLTLDEIDDLLRIGYTVRIVDEVVGLEPSHESFLDN